MFKQLWEMISANIKFFSGFDTFHEYEIDCTNMVFTQCGKLSTDSLSLILYLYRDRFLKMEFSNDTEFRRIKKHLYQNDIDLPLAKKDYDEYMNDLHSSIDILRAFEDTLGMDKDYIFTVPTREKIAEQYSNAAVALEDKFPKMFLYSGHKARCSIDFNGFVSAIDIFTESDIFHIESSDDGCTAFNEFGLADTANFKELIVSEMSAIKKRREKTIYVSFDTVSSVEKFFGMYETVDIQIDSLALVYELIRNNYYESDKVVKINGDLVVSYVLSSIEKATKIKDYSTRYNRIVEVAKIGSVLSKKEKNFITTGLSGKLDDDIFSAIEYIISEDNSNINNKLASFFNEKGVMLVAKIQSTIPEVVVYCEHSNSIRAIPMDRQSIASVLIPELGGIMHTVSSLHGDNSSTQNVETLVITQMLYFLQDNYSLLSDFKGTRGLGIFKGDDLVVNIGGTPSRRVDSGYVYLNQDNQKPLSQKKVTQKSATSSFESIKVEMSESLESASTALLLLVSMNMTHIVKPLYAFNAVIHTETEGQFEFIKKGFFDGIFRYYNDALGHSSPLIEQMLFSSSSPTIVGKIDSELKDLYSSPYCSRYAKAKSSGRVLENSKIGQVIISEKCRVNIYNPARIEMSTSPSLLLNMHSPKTTEISMVMSFIASNSRKVIEARDSIRNDFSSMIKDGLFDGSSDAYYLFEQILPALVLDRVVSGTSNAMETMRRIIVNHFRYPILSKKDISRYVNKKNNCVEVIAQSGKKLLVGNLSHDEILKYFSLFSVPTEQAFDNIAESTRVIPEESLKNYKQKDGKSLLQKNIDSSVYFVL